ncbi:hypothetical protein P4T04_08855 [Bacillus badius]|uniref:hypothetical protein n=1 Tax=Bacillus badius TaxID=1455 RepID=UPI0007B0603A|nr:hypothetical protein [Bacillus badius]KZN98603.1 hypothetical protein A4244_05655 [Bacillus badius]MED0666418.1 hypothetical protein [Bacillus badius]OCS83543.1 hypothetical protein A6M11_05660 [Bacillus badius]OVE53172.1 hypothetical protein B1A98_06230 [Bacillus badius]TDW05228.1 hypothetical protein B0G66_102671 [Bacillus badius]
MLNDTLFASDGLIVFFTFWPIIINIIFMSLGIYFVMKTLQFMNTKIKLDRERNEKLGELIKAAAQSKDLE